jgi:uncharacterized integral membrane protein (TIGR00698 family)
MAAPVSVRPTLEGPAVIPASSTAAATEAPAPPRSTRVSVRSVLPGVAAAAGITVVASVFGRYLPVIGAPVCAIVLGMAFSVVRSPSEAFHPGLAFTSKRVLQASIVLLGFGLSVRQVLSTGESSLPVLLGTLLIALALAWLVGRALGLSTDLKTLIGVGTAICGASAIAATDAVIGAAEADVSYAIATIFTFNVVAVLTYPVLGHLFGLSQHAFGLWAGTAINDTSSVVAASNVYGHVATSYGVIVKLTRTLAIIPVCLVLAFLRNRNPARRTVPGLELGPDPTAPAGAVSGAVSGRQVASATPLRRVFPLFILGFVAAVGCNTLGLVPGGAHHWLSDAAAWMITAALAAIGLSTRLGLIRRAGARPLLLGAVLWASVGVASLLLQGVTGTI